MPPGAQNDIFILDILQPDTIMKWNMRKAEFGRGFAFRLGELKRQKGENYLPRGPFAFRQAITKSVAVCWQGGPSRKVQTMALRSSLLILSLLALRRAQRGTHAFCLKIH